MKVMTIVSTRPRLRKKLGGKKKLNTQIRLYKSFGFLDCYVQYVNRYVWHKI